MTREQFQKEVSERFQNTESGFGNMTQRELILLQISSNLYEQQAIMKKKDNIQKHKTIADNYHDRTCMSCLSMENQVCECCGNVVHYTTSIEHDSQDYSKDLSVCSNCYGHITSYWKTNKPNKIAPR